MFYNIDSKEELLVPITLPEVLLKLNRVMSPSQATLKAKIALHDNTRLAKPRYSQNVVKDDDLVNFPKAILFPPYFAYNAFT